LRQDKLSQFCFFLAVLIADLAFHVFILHGFLYTSY